VSSRYKTKINADTNFGHLNPVNNKGVNSMDRVALIVAILGAINWGSIGLFRYDLVAAIFGGQTATLSRIVYSVIALAGIWCITLLFRNHRRHAEDF